MPPPKPSTSPSAASAPFRRALLIALALGVVAGLPGSVASGRPQDAGPQGGESSQDGGRPQDGDPTVAAAADDEERILHHRLFDRHQLFEDDTPLLPLAALDFEDEQASGDSVQPAEPVQSGEPVDEGAVATGVQVAEEPASPGGDSEVAAADRVASADTDGAPATAPAPAPAPAAPAAVQVERAGDEKFLPRLDVYFPEGELDLRVSGIVDKVFFEGQVQYNFVDGDITAYLRYRYYSRFHPVEPCRPRRHPEMLHT